MPASTGHKASHSGSQLAPSHIESSNKTGGFVFGRLRPPDPQLPPLYKSKTLHDVSLSKLNPLESTALIEAGATCRAIADGPEGGLGFPSAQSSLNYSQDTLTQRTSQHSIATKVEQHTAAAGKSPMGQKQYLCQT